jgi:hypothetical protein
MNNDDKQLKIIDFKLFMSGPTMNVGLWLKRHEVNLDNCKILITQIWAMKNHLKFYNYSIDSLKIKILQFVNPSGRKFTEFSGLNDLDFIW